MRRSWDYRSVRLIVWASTSLEGFQTFFRWGEGCVQRTGVGLPLIAYIVCVFDHPLPSVFCGGSLPFSSTSSPAGTNQYYYTRTHKQARIHRRFTKQSRSNEYLPLVWVSWVLSRVFYYLISFSMRFRWLLADCAPRLLPRQYSHMHNTQVTVHLAGHTPGYRNE